MFIIYVNDLTSNCDSFYPILYADDTTLCATLNSHWNTLDNLTLNNELVQISDWLKLNKLSLNVSKTKAMLFRTPQRNANYPELYINDTKIQFVADFNFLGIILNENLKWKSHANMVAKKISKTIGVMTRLKNVLPVNVLRNIYNALILSHLNYGNIIWGTCKTYLFKLQKKAVRIIKKTKYNAHTTPLFKDLKLLKLEDLCALHDFKFCFKFCNSILPSYFLTDMLNRITGNIASYDTRQTATFRLPAVSHEFARNCISYKFPLVFNNLEQNIKAKLFSHSFQGFKQYVKNRLLDSYIESCTIPDCYICQN